MSLKLSAGSATANITPPLGTAIPGGFRPRYATGIDDELLARSLVLQNGITTLAFVTCDLIVVSEKISEHAKRRISERCEIPPGNVMINATHTHTGVATSDLLGVDEDHSYTDGVSLKIADSVELALRRLRPAKIGFAVAIEDRISFYRRWFLKNGNVVMNPGVENPDLVRPVSEIDPELSMIYVQANDGTPISAVANFSLHYVGTDNGSTISADYFGHFSRLMKRYIGETCVAMIWNAASGQINNIDFSGQTKWQDRGHQQAIRMANVLAGHFITEMQFMTLRSEIELTSAIETMTIPRKSITEKDLATATEILGASPNFNYENGPFSWVVGQPIPKNLVDVYAHECQRLAKLPDQLSAKVQLLRIGEAMISALPGEIFVEIGKSIKTITKGEPNFVVSLANGYIGYICTDDALSNQGGYETWAAMSSIGGIGTAPMLEKTIEHLLSKLS